MSNERSAADLPTVRVVAAALYDAAGRVLIASGRPASTWRGAGNFPAARLDPGESEAAALTRELAEELGISVRRARPLMRLVHDYDDRRVDIALWLVRGVQRRAARLVTASA